MRPCTLTHASAVENRTAALESRCTIKSRDTKRGMKREGICIV